VVREDAARRSSSVWPSRDNARRIAELERVIGQLRMENVFSLVCDERDPGLRPRTGCTYPRFTKDQDAEWRSRIERTDESAHETARHCERKDHSISAWPREGTSWQRLRARFMILLHGSGFI
jgi:hypothetical protein